MGWLACIYVLVWAGFIAAVLSRKDIEPIEKLIWLVTVIFVPLFGILFYLFIEPGSKTTTPLPDDQQAQSPQRGKKINLQSDVAGTPWQNDPGHIA